MAEADAYPVTPTSWLQLFALFHRLWGNARAGTYDKALWARAFEGLQQLARGSEASMSPRLK